MDRLKAILREPALLVDLAETILVVAVAYGWALSRDQQGYIVAAIIAVAALIKGFTTHPFPVTVFPDATRAILVVAVSVFGAALTADQIAVTATLVGTIVTIIARAQVDPLTGPVAAPQSSRHVKHKEAGETALSIVGLVLLVLGVLLLILKAVGAFHPLALVWIIVLIVIGGIVFFLGRRTTV